MEDLKTFEEVLDFAISNEIDAANMYTELANNTTVPGMKETLLQFANEEKGHRAKLEGIKSGSSALPLDTKVTNLKMAEYLSDVDLEPNMDYQQTLIFAMKKEKQAFKLYSTLAEFAEDQGLKDTFFALAQEEAKHKLRFELEYDENILTDN